MEKNYDILIVEDIPSWQKTLKRYLQHEPFTIFIASNYQDALNLIETKTFDLVILDVNLTGVTGNYDGLRIGDNLWSRNTGTKIIIISGTGDSERHLREWDFEPSCVLKKQSLEQDEFIKKIYEALT
jgi:DNA-binding response OmpR family regulator